MTKRDEINRTIRDHLHDQQGNLVAHLIQQREASLKGTLLARTNNGCPYPGGGAVEFDRTEIAKFGKFIVYGSSACTRFIVTLRDGRQVFIRGGDQSKDAERWIRKIAKTVPNRLPNRIDGWTLTEVEVS
jgi:hypothetical protein